MRVSKNRKLAACTPSTVKRPPRFKGNIAHLSPDAVVDFVLANGGRSSNQPDQRRIDRQPLPTGVNGADAGHSKTPRLRFIDLFCGIGGFRLAFGRAGAHCVFSSDWDKFSRQTYAANFGEEPAGDINSVPIADIPPFDILCGGFPCQPFSLAGVSKKNSLGRKHGFDDVRQGNLFFTIADILEHHQPPASVLENAKHVCQDARHYAISA